MTTNPKVKRGEYITITAQDPREWYINEGQTYLVNGTEKCRSCHSDETYYSCIMHDKNAVHVYLDKECNSTVRICFSEFKSMPETEEITDF